MLEIKVLPPKQRRSWRCMIPFPDKPRWIAADDVPCRHGFQGHGARADYCVHAHLNARMDKGFGANPGAGADPYRSRDQRHIGVIHIMRGRAQKCALANRSVWTDFDTVDRIQIDVMAHGRVIAQG